MAQFHTAVVHAAMNYICIYTACVGRIGRLGFSILVYLQEFSVILWWLISLLKHIPIFRRASDSENCVDQKDGQDPNGYVPDWLHSETYDDDKHGENPIQIQKNTVRYRELITEFHKPNEFISQVQECDVGSVEESDHGINESLDEYYETLQDALVMAEASESLNECCETVQNTLVMTETVEAENGEDGEMERDEDPDEDALVVDNGCVDVAKDLVDICSETVQHVSDNSGQGELQGTANEEDPVGLVMDENLSSVETVAGLDACDDISKDSLDSCSATNEYASAIEENEEYERFEDRGHEASADGFSSLDDYDDDEDHDFFIEKLRSEIRRLRGGNLSVIPEESESDLAESSVWGSESGASMEDSPSSFRKTEPEEDSIEAFYEKYSERIRCLDKLNSQQTYALGVLQSHETRKPKGVTSRLKRYILNKPAVTDGSQESLKRVQQDLETVYVGQTCLSWEALQWQYRKFREAALCGSEQDLFYDRVADQFQQFQVLLQRFLENEQFEGPRILNYVKSRCTWSSLLQVPLVKGSMKEVGTEANTITAAQLVSILEESIMIFWDFVRSDKHKSLGQHQMLNFLCVSQEVEDPNDSTLLHSMRRSVHCKELKVRELQRRGRCLIKRLDPVARGEGIEILMALVDIKLVSRVLRMSRITTDHLQWCQKRLGKLSIRKGKVHRARGTVLFPY